jgi:hypothetical protein
MRETFLLTSTNREMLECAAKVYGGTVKPWEGHPGQFALDTERTQLRVAVSTSQTLSQSYERWSGGGCTHRCDGVTCEVKRAIGTGREMRQERTTVPCLCNPESPECKMVTRVSVMLTELPTVGIWRLDTHGTIAGLEMPAFVEMIQQLGFAAGPVFCILTVEQQEIKSVGKAAQKFAIPSLSLDPDPPGFVALIQRAQMPALMPVSQAPAAIATNNAPALEAPAASADDDAKRLAKVAGERLKQMGIGQEEFGKFKGVCEARGRSWSEAARAAFDAGARTPAQAISFVETGTVHEKAPPADPFADPETPPTGDSAAPVIDADFREDGAPERPRFVDGVWMLGNRVLDGPPAGYEEGQEPLL